MIEQTLADLVKVLTRIADQGDVMLAQRGTVTSAAATAPAEPVKETPAKADKKPAAKPKAEPVKETPAPLEVVEPEATEDEEEDLDVDPEATVTEEDIRQWRRDQGEVTKDLAALKKVFAETIAAHGGVLDGKPNLPAVPKENLGKLLAALNAAVAA